MSHKEHTEKRNAILLTIYPPGITTREDVQKKWEPITAQIIADRPVEGWAEFPNSCISSRAIKVEKMSRNRVYLLEKYWGPDGFFDLCYCWFFYDKENKIIDAQWQYCSD